MAALTQHANKNDLDGEAILTSLVKLLDPRQAKSQSEGILNHPNNLTRHNRRNQAQQKIINKLATEVAQVAQAAFTAIMRDIQDVKEEWGDQFFLDLRKNNVYLPSRMSQLRTELMSRIAKSYTMLEFCSTISPILRKPRKSAKNQEKVPGAAGRVVQTEDLRQCWAALSSPREGTASPTPDASTRRVNLEDDVKEDAQDELPELSRCYIDSDISSGGLSPLASGFAGFTLGSVSASSTEASLTPNAPHMSPIIMSDHRSPTRSNEGDSARSVYDSTKLTPHRFTSSPCPRNKASVPLDRRQGRRDTETVIPTQAGDTPSALLERKRKHFDRHTDVPTSRPNKMMKPTHEPEPELRNTSPQPQTGGHPAQLPCPVAQTPPRETGTTVPVANHTPTKQVSTIYSLASTAMTRRSKRLSLQSVGSAVESPPIRSQHQLDASTTNTIMEDLTPGQLLRGITIHSLIKMFIPTSVLRIVEVGNNDELRSTISKFIARGPAVGCNFLCYLCHMNHWIGVLYRADRGTVSVIDSSVGAIAVAQIDAFVREVSLGIHESFEGVQVTRVNYQTPQQPNNFDCGIYLVVCVIREIAQPQSSTGAENATTCPINGAFFRTLFTYSLHAPSDLPPIVEAILPPDSTPVLEPTTLATNLQRARMRLNRVHECKSSTDATVQLFASLEAALQEDLVLLKSRIDQFESFRAVLADSTPAFKACLSKDSKADERCQGLETIAAEAGKNLQKRIHEVGLTRDAIANILARLQLITAFIENIEQSTKASVQEHEQEARQVWRQTKMRIEEMRQKLEEDQKLTSELDAVLSTEDDL